MSDTFDTFDDLTCGLSSATPLSEMFDAAEEHLAAACPEGFTPEDIGRLAWQSLPGSERAEAMDQLLYGFWAARENDREELARWEREHEVRDQLKGALFLYRLAADCPTPVSYELLAEIARLANQLMGGGQR